MSQINGTREYEKEYVGLAAKEAELATLRGVAKKQGLSLRESGLFDWLRKNTIGGSRH